MTDEAKKLRNIRDMFHANAQRRGIASAKYTALNDAYRLRVTLTDDTLNEWVGEFTAQRAAAAMQAAREDAELRARRS